MKHHKGLKLFIILSVLFFVLSNTGLAQQPAYAKWGNIAVEKTKEKYPDHKVVDYSYDGKVFITSKREQYNFKLTLEQNGKREEVRVYVLKNPKTDQLIDVYFDELTNS